MPPIRSTTPLGIALIAMLLAVTLGSRAASAQDTGWTITSFVGAYEIRQDGTVTVVETIDVDFGSLERHGIFRDIPVEYAYDDSNNRLIEIADVAVTDGDSPLDWRIDAERPSVRIRIGDPDVLVSGTQTYEISYTMHDALNPFETHDEFYVNVTGNDWPVTIENASATVVLPAGDIHRVTCFEGPTGSTAPCQSSFGGGGALFSSRPLLSPGYGLTVVVAIDKGIVNVAPPMLVSNSTDVWAEVNDFMGFEPLPIGLSLAIGAVGFAVLFRLWWAAGRDRWYGNTAHVVQGAIPAETMPAGAHESIVVEYTPPEVGANGRDSKRRLRPAEIGVLMDETADTLDVSATIVDLAVRKHLRIIELEEGGIFGIFKKQDYELEKLENPADDLLRYEEQLLTALFDGKQKVKLSDLRNKFHTELKRVKTSLYRSSVKDLKFFPQSPEAVRNTYQVAAGVSAVAGGGLIYLLGTQTGAGIIGVPFILLGGLLFVFAGAMPRRTARGRQAYRRALGFRLYMETAETDRQRFAENENIFHEYLPYAIVYECVDKWAEVFDDLGLEPRADYYVGHRGFLPLRFASTMSSFSSSISTTMASTPGSSGGSGFGGGGSGGGVGGGGGGSW